MNDPNGIVKCGEWYHLFFQHNPFDDTWGTIHWGHARSGDLLHWEHLPIALTPSPDIEEQHCYSGCCALAEQQPPRVFYTSIGPGSPADGSPNQRFAIGDAELLTWKRPPDSLLIDASIHPGLKVAEWRDPFVFRHAGRVFMMLGGRILPGSHEKPGPVILLYEAGADLQNWTYRGVLFRHPDPALRSIECPNMIRMGDRWLLICSNWDRVEYFVGHFDPDAATFHSSKRGLVDERGNFYATNLYEEADGRVLLVGWLRGFARGRGWAGCLSLPREIELSPAGGLVQRPFAGWDRLPRDPANLGDLPPVVDILARLGSQGRITLLTQDGTVVFEYVASGSGETDLGETVRVVGDGCVVEVFGTGGCRSYVLHCPIRGGRVIAENAFVEAWSIRCDDTPSSVDVSRET